MLCFALNKVAHEFNPDEAFMLSNIYDTYAFIPHHMKTIFRGGLALGIDIVFLF